MTNSNTHPSLYVKPEDTVTPIRELRTKSGAVSAELGEPIMAKELWKEQHDGRE
jgi:hypothetical protein